MNRFSLFIKSKTRPLVFGCVHLDALPGYDLMEKAFQIQRINKSKNVHNFRTPRSKKSLDQISEKAIKEAQILEQEGVVRHLHLFFISTKFL